MPSKKMGNKSLSPSLAAFGFTSKKPTPSTADSSPSLASFGFTSKKRKGDDDGDDVRPSKRGKTCAVGGGSQDNTVDLSQDAKMVDLSQDSNDGSKNGEGPSGESKGETVNRKVEATSQSKSTAPQNTEPAGQKTNNAANATAQASPQRNNDNEPNSIGFVRVSDPNNILCTATAAQARSNNNSGNNSIRPLFAGATIGRFSNSATKDVHFLNIGIKAEARGISRKHVSVLRINGLPGDHHNDQDDNASIVTAHSSNSVKSSASQQNNPTILIKVLEHPDPTKQTNHVVIHRTRRNKRRRLDLKQKECKTLRVGDVLEFRNDLEKYYFCVVVFHRSDTDSGVEDKEQTIAPVLAPKAINMDNFVDDSVEIHTARESGSESNVVDMTVDEEMAETKTEHHNDRLSLTQDMIVDEAKMKSTTNEEVETIESIARQENEPEGAVSTQMFTEAPLGMTDSKTKPEHNSKSPTKADTIKPKVEMKISPCKLATSATKMSQKLTVNPVQTVEKGDHVRVVYQLKDSFDIEHEEWYYGKVGLIRKNKQGTQNINIALDCGENDNFDIPHPEVEAVSDMSMVFSRSWKIGDFVECKFQDGRNWWHGRIADLSDDGAKCDVMYHDNDYEVNIPTNQNRIRVSRPCDSDYRWLVNKPVLIGQKGIIDKVNASTLGECEVVLHDGSTISSLYQDIIKGNGIFLLSNSKPPKKKNVNYCWLQSCDVIIGRKGVIKDAPAGGLVNKCLVEFEDGAEESIDCDDAVKGSFAYLLQGVGLERQFIWPETHQTDSASLMKTKHASAPRPEPTNKVPRGGSRRSSDKRVSIKLEHDVNDYKPVKGHCLVMNSSSHSAVDENAEDYVDGTHDDLDSEFRFIGKKKVAFPLPAGIPNMLWHALNCPEAKTGYNMLQDFLSVHDRVPGHDMVRKLWQLMIKGPKADGHSVFFKDPFRTELASQYVYCLVHHSKRLVRNDGSALFGPSDWSDIEYLLSQPIDQTENMVAGKRLADGLHLAARGSKLLLLLLQTELRDTITTSPRSVTFEMMPLQAMPTVSQFKARGIRDSLKSAVRHTTKCLVQHSRFILDMEDFHPERQSCKDNLYDESCANEATACFENLGNVISYCAFLFCVEERIQLDDQSVLFIIRDEFEKELLRCLDDLPDMNKTSAKKFSGILRECFLGVIGGDFSLPLFVGLSKLMGNVKDVVALGIIVE